MSLAQEEIICILLNTGNIAMSAYIKTFKYLTNSSALNDEFFCPRNSLHHNAMQHNNRIYPKFLI